MKKFIKWYACSFGLSWILLAGLLFYFGLTWVEIKQEFMGIAEQAGSYWGYWLLLLLPYLLAQLVQHLKQTYRQAGFVPLLKRGGLLIGLPLLALTALGQLSTWYVHSENFVYQWDTTVENQLDTATNFQKRDGKQRGVHVFGRLDSLSLGELLKNNVEWITLVPFGGQSDYDSPRVRMGRDSLRQLRRDSFLKQNIRVAHAAGLKIFLKPHIWMSNPSDGKWRSDIFPTNEAAWEEWSASYRKFLLHYAKVAAQNEVELFCVGTEFTKLTKEKPLFWSTLIADIRSFYEGELTYAANWYQDFEQITFWKDLDYIGIQAYFPLTKNENPSVAEIKAGWKPHLKAIERVQKQFGKPILFTELGYKSTPDSAIEPWLWPSYDTNLVQKISNETQANCYEAFFQTVWHKKWFAGIHIWQWHTERRRRGDMLNHGFTPRQKPAENIIAKGFGSK